MIWSLFLLVDEELDVDLHQQYKDVGRQSPKALPIERLVCLLLGKNVVRHLGMSPPYLYVYICIAGSMVEP